MGRYKSVSKTWARQISNNPVLIIFISDKKIDICLKRLRKTDL